MKELKDIVAENLIFLRKQNKLTQLELAEKLNYSDKSVSKWEHGETLPDIEVLKKIADLYNVTLDYIVSEDKHEDKLKFIKGKKNKPNQIIISLLGISFVWIAAVLIFVYSNIILNANYWLVFVWALPVCCVVLFYFNKVWGNKKQIYFILSFFVWTILLCVYLQFLTYNMYLIFLIAIPVQVAIVLWSKLKQ